MRLSQLFLISHISTELPMTTNMANMSGIAETEFYEARWRFWNPISSVSALMACIDLDKMYNVRQLQQKYLLIKDRERENKWHM